MSMDKFYNSDGQCVLVVFPRAANPHELGGTPHGHCHVCRHCLDHAGIPLSALGAWLQGAGYPMVVCERCNANAQRVMNEVESIIDKVLPHIKRAYGARNN
jgi:hypothetical protein